MMEKILRKKSLSQWVKRLEAYKIYAPVKDGDFWNFALIDNSEDLNLNHSNTVLSPKKIIFPQREVFLEFSTSNDGELETKEILPEEKASIIFGVRPCDARAIPLMDKVFGGDLLTLTTGKEETKRYWLDFLAIPLHHPTASVSLSRVRLTLKKA